MVSPDFKDGKTDNCNTSVMRDLSKATEKRIEAPDDQVNDELTMYFTSTDTPFRWGRYGIPWLRDKGYTEGKTITKTEKSKPTSVNRGQSPIICLIYLDAAWSWP